jgi:hypothetical protein
MDSVVTVEHLERAISVTAACMARHSDLARRLMPTLKRLEAERDNLIANGDPVEYAKRILARRGLQQQCLAA